MDFVIIRTCGKIYKIRKAPQESTEKATDRAWYIAKSLEDQNLTSFEKESRSHIWANEKYYGMSYYSTSTPSHH